MGTNDQNANWCRRLKNISGDVLIQAEGVKRVYCMNGTITMHIRSGNQYFSFKLP